MNHSSLFKLGRHREKREVLRSQDMLRWDKDAVYIPEILPQKRERTSLLVYTA